MTGVSGHSWPRASRSLSASAILEAAAIDLFDHLAVAIYTVVLHKHSSTGLLPRRRAQSQVGSLTPAIFGGRRVGDEGRPTPKRRPGIASGLSRRAAKREIRKAC